MNVLLDASQVALEHVHLVNSEASSGTLSLSDHVDPFKVLCLVESWNIARVQNIVDVFKHLLVDDLGVHKEERCGLAIDTSLHENSLGILSPITHGVTLDDLNLVQFVV